jgi:hypothetical protein
VREEARVGQRTTLDVLNAQQDLVNARVALVTAQRDRVVASFRCVTAGRARALRALVAIRLHQSDCRLLSRPHSKLLADEVIEGRSLNDDQPRPTDPPPQKWSDLRYL